ncbi:MAG: hypothetical protein AAB897_02025 [Patescibacteria group bacterium]
MSVPTKRKESYEEAVKRLKPKTNEVVFERFDGTFCKLPKTIRDETGQTIYIQWGEP